ncbi:MULTISPECIES: nuclear transport factor 2 family protein [Lysobacter]|uniref:Nuclear transport factor 2 family protein n=1 Tax=Lysobacter firmicutimachus TaxID=1792846 RepID=A0ABU8D117_9GAMM|nr:nuclear transport factor 2 family protein [Lysobacter antibioticus]
MDAAQARALIERYIAAYNAFDIDGMLATLAPQLRFENWSGGQLTAEADGIEAFRVLAEQGAQLFAQREQRVLDLRLDSARAEADIGYRGRLALDLPGGPPAGTVLELQGTSEFGFADGRIARIVDRS